MHLSLFKYLQEVSLLASWAKFWMCEGGREGKGREGKGREGKGREGKGREGKGREGKGREGKGGREGGIVHLGFRLRARV